MLTYQDLDQYKKAFIFELDNVLYPERDYLLQVYYLFANLLEYTETVPPATDLAAFFKRAYEHHGADGIFERAIDAFEIDEKYRENFNRIHVSAKLPLPLLMFSEVEKLLQEILDNKKQIFMLTRGNPLMQLNKIKQLNWGALGKAVKVYFYDELVLRGYQEPLLHLLQENGLHITDVLVFGAGNTNDLSRLGIDYLAIDTLLK